MADRDLVTVRDALREGDGPVFERLRCADRVDEIVVLGLTDSVCCAVDVLLSDASNERLALGDLVGLLVTVDSLEGDIGLLLYVLLVVIVEVISRLRVREMVVDFVAEG